VGIYPKSQSIYQIFHIALVISPFFLQIMMSKNADSSQQRDSQREREGEDRVFMNSAKAMYDSDIYGNDTANLSEYAMDVGADDGSDVEDDNTLSGTHPSSQIGPSRSLINSTIGETADTGISAEFREQRGSGLVNTRISDRESSYHARRFNRSDANPIQKNDEDESSSSSSQGRRSKRWGDATDLITSSSTSSSSWDNMSAPEGDTNTKSKWEETPVLGTGTTSSKSTWDETPLGVTDATPLGSTGGRRKRSRWEETPTESITSGFNETPRSDQVNAVLGRMQAVASSTSTGAISEQQKKWEQELQYRNRPLSDVELDAMFPMSGYTILTPPPDYKPAISRQGSNNLSEPTQRDDDEFTVQQTLSRDSYGIQLTKDDGSLPTIKPEDYQYFGKLLDESIDISKLSAAEIKERKVMTLLLKIKNGNPPQRKTAMRQITDKARDFGPEILFNQILPLLMSPALEDQERHLLVKVIDRVLLKLSDLIRPYVHKILQVIEPLLIDEDYFARMEGREIISNLAKAAGLGCMISTMREDIDSSEEYVRNTTACAFAVVASALGIPQLLPFLQAVCQSRKSWEARHTGIKIVQQIAILMGSAILPHLKFMVAIIQHGLTDEQQKVRTITAFAIAAMAESSFPYGIEAFDDIIRPLWMGTRQYHQKPLAAFLKAVGFIIPLMEDVHADHYTRQVMVTVVREFANPDEEMKKVVLKVMQQCVATDGVQAEYIKEILPDFFRNFWVRRMALDRRNYKHVVETTVEISNKVGSSEILSRIVDDLKDESAPYRSMVMETTEKILMNLGAADIDLRLEERLIDGILYSFQEQADDTSNVILNGFGTVVNALGERMKPYFPQICGTIKWRLNNKSATVRMQAADLTSKIAVVMRQCKEDQLMGHLGVVLYEYLGEEYPEVLGSILKALTAIVTVIGMDNMTPPIRDLLPRLTPILKNRHEKVQEHLIELVGKIADRGAEFVSPREWMRICFELLDMLKAKRKSIQKAAVSTFGYIAKSIGPQDVLHTLLNNLKVQERQMRVCTTVAIAIVAETCSPFTVIPALMNEYRIPDVHVQNGVLKAMSFMFEYIGDTGKDYVYAVAPLVVDALTDRDNVHRQTAATIVQHLALGVTGQGCEDVLGHLLNYVWPNIFEESPHVINANIAAIEALMVALGPAKIMMYLLQGLFHPARKVRETYWKIYNALYIRAQDSMVAVYPRIENDNTNNYRRTELELFL
jgi:splicing factor 3B subunit 1